MRDSKQATGKNATVIGASDYVVGSEIDALVVGLLFPHLRIRNGSVQVLYTPRTIQTMAHESAYSGLPHLGCFSYQRCLCR